VDLANVIISGISAAVALVSAAVAGVSALRSRKAKEIAEPKRDEAVEAAKNVASGVDRLVRVQESRQTARSPRRRPASWLCYPGYSVDLVAGGSRTTAAGL
jgi:hypothetical protein